MAAKKKIPAGQIGTRRRKPQGREVRVLQHIGLEPPVAEDLDTLSWFRTQQYYRALRDRNKETKVIKPLKEELFDEAARAFLAAPRNKRPPLRPAASGDVRLTFWLSASLTKELEAIAAEKGVSMSRVMDSAITYFVNERLTDAARELRRDTEQRAARFLDRMFET